MTAEEFIEGYAERSRVSVEWLVRHGRVVVPCSCDYEGCEGWALVGEESYREDQEVYGLPVDIRYPRNASP